MRHALLLLLTMYAVPAAAQERLETKLVVQQGGREIGREEYTLRPTRGRGLPGSTLTASARYPAIAATTRLSATLERTPEGALAKFQLDVDSSGVVTVILAAGSGARLVVRTVGQGSESGRELPGGPDVVLLDEQVFSLYTAGSGARLVVRTVGQGSESGRELPGGPDVVLLDEQVFSLYTAVADLATPEGRALTAVFPRTGKRANFTARREGGGGAGRVALSGGIAGTLMVDAQSRVQRLELPGQGLVVTKVE